MHSTAGQEAGYSWLCFYPKVYDMQEQATRQLHCWRMSALRHDDHLTLAQVISLVGCPKMLFSLHDEGSLRKGVDTIRHVVQIMTC